MRTILAALAAVFTSCAMVASPGAAQDFSTVPDKADGAVRFATFNVKLHGDREGEIVERLASGEDRIARLTAEIVRAYRPDVLLIQELDRDDDGEALRLYTERFLAGDLADAPPPVAYPHTALLPTNTGVASGIDLDGNGDVGESGRSYGNDAFGFGEYPGQYAFSVASRFPIGEVRTFSEFLWRDMPGNRMGDLVPEAAQEVRRLSSKTHALVPININGTTVTLVASHPTPPAFADVNVPRNADEIRLVHDLLDARTSQYATDDAGVSGGLEPWSLFVVAGDLNSDPVRGSSEKEAIRALLEDPRLTDPQQMSDEGQLATAEFSSGFRLRVDYVVPSAELEVVGSGVHWPKVDDTIAQGSDHRLVYVDVRLPESE